MIVDDVNKCFCKANQSQYYVSSGTQYDSLLMS